MDKSIDLGKLQNDLLKAKATEKDVLTKLSRAKMVLNTAQSQHDKIMSNYGKAEKDVDKAKTAVLEAARTVTAA